MTESTHRIQTFVNDDRVCSEKYLNENARILSAFQRQGAAYRKERLVIFKEDRLGGRVSVRNPAVMHTNY